MAATPEDIVRAFVRENKLGNLGNTKALGVPTLFYSPFYKKLFNVETDKIAAELLFTAENVLTNFDYRSIDSVADNNPTVSYSAEGEIVYSKPNPTSYIATQLKNPVLINDSYLIYETSIFPIIQSLNTDYGTTYKSLLSKFGHIEEGQQNITPNIPRYDNNGNASYDLEIDILDVAGVISYKTYTIEEVV
jgi:hypothetical protein